MAIPHARPGQPIDIHPLGEALRFTATHAIVKTHALELIRVVLRGGQALPPHRVAGESTLLCLEGELAVTIVGHTVRISAGQVVLLPAHCEHAVQALSDASGLLTMQLPPGLPGSASATG
jgi:quercetin dioxygenase-like cupin family protein